MKTKAAVFWEFGRELEVIELELDPPKANEVLVRFVASGVCHSDYHVKLGDLPVRLPTVGGHEGAGVVEAVGPGVTRVKPGDHVVCSFIPSCGHCRWCVTGHSSLCDVGIHIHEGCLPDGTFRFHAQGKDFGTMCSVGTFSQYTVVSEYAAVKIDESIPLEVACLTGCGVPTGWNSAVKGADVEPGDTIVIYGCGGVGINAVQGARYAGAKNVVVVDPVAFKREKAKQLGATHTAASAEEAKELVLQLTNGVWADKAIITVGLVDEQVVQNAFDIIRKRGTIVLTALGPFEAKTIHLSGTMLTAWEKRIQGLMAGSSNFQYDIPKLLGLYRAGHLKLDELVTRRYKLDEINQAFKDMIDGKNIRGVIIHEHY